MGERGEQIAKWWATGVESLLELPPEMVAPVLGASWFGVFAPMGLPVHIQGPSYSGKTTLGRIGAQFATDHPILGPAASAWGAPDMGSTWVGLHRAIDTAALGTFFIDDVVSLAGTRASVARLDQIAAHVLGLPGGRSSRGATERSVATVLTASTERHSPDTARSVYRVEYRFIQVPHQASVAMKGQAGVEARSQLGRVYRNWVSDQVDLEDQHRIFVEGAFGEIARRAGGRSRTLRLQVRARVDAAFGLHLMTQMLGEQGTPVRDDIAGLMDALHQDAESLLPEHGGSIVELADDEMVVQPVRAAAYDATSDLRAAMEELLAAADPGVVLQIDGRVLGRVRDGKLLLVPGEVRALLSRRSKRYQRLSMATLGKELEAAGFLSAGADGKRSRVYRIDGVPKRMWEVSKVAAPEGAH